MTYTQELDTRHMLLVYGMSKMEEQMGAVAANWSTGNLSGDFAAEGRPDIRYSVTRSDSAGSGGISGALMAINVTTYDDTNGSDTLNSGEKNIVLSTKVGKFATYESEAGS
jgi:hypothetical protein